MKWAINLCQVTRYIASRSIAFEKPDYFVVGRASGCPLAAARRQYERQLSPSAKAKRGKWSVVVLTITNPQFIRNTVSVQFLISHVWNFSSCFSEDGFVINISGFIKVVVHPYLRWVKFYLKKVQPLLIPAFHPAPVLKMSTRPRKTWTQALRKRKSTLHFPDRRKISRESDTRRQWFGRVASLVLQQVS